MDASGLASQSYPEAALDASSMPEELRERAEGFAAAYGLVPIAFNLATVAIDDLVKAFTSEGSQGLHATACIGLGFKTDASLQNILTVQLAVMPWVYGTLRSERSVFRQVVLPFVVKYWWMRFTEGRFSFATPDLLDGQLKAAMEARPSRRAQEVLRVIAEGLRLRVTPEAKEWLEQPPSAADE